MRADDRPTFVPADAGLALEFLGVTHKLTSRQTGGTICLFESTFDPGTGNRLHAHGREDEIGFVIDGALEIRLADRTEVLSAGGIARLPRGIPHAIRNPLEAPSRYLFIAVPGGLDRWFDAVAAAQQDGQLDDVRFRALSSDFGLDWLE
ncbi:MAG TPA: cupin domain-containing protein [Candidatus Limnocylindrales bacterium]|jgi:quercetin dioxygenase-like cupin family protein